MNLNPYLASVSYSIAFSELNWWSKDRRMRQMCECRANITVAEFNTIGLPNWYMAWEWFTAGTADDSQSIRAFTGWMMNDRNLRMIHKWCTSSRKTWSENCKMDIKQGGYSYCKVRDGYLQKRQSQHFIISSISLYKIHSTSKMQGSIREEEK